MEPIQKHDACLRRQLELFTPNAAMAHARTESLASTSYLTGNTVDEFTGQLGVCFDYTLDDITNFLAEGLIGDLESGTPISTIARESRIPVITVRGYVEGSEAYLADDVDAAYGKNKHGVVRIPGQRHSQVYHRLLSYYNTNHRHVRVPARVVNAYAQKNSMVPLIKLHAAAPHMTDAEYDQFFACVAAINPRERGWKSYRRTVMNALNEVMAQAV